MHINPITTYKAIQPAFQANAVIPNSEQRNELRVFTHHIYEYKKGLRNLILTTEKKTNEEVISDRLERENIDYLIQDIGPNKINVFFGNPKAVEVIKSFKNSILYKYSPEQDFILGTLLGYDKIQQCERYLKQKEKQQKKINTVA